MLLLIHWTLNSSLWTESDNLDSAEDGNVNYDIAERFGFTVNETKRDMRAGKFHIFTSSLFSPIWFVLKIESDERRKTRRKFFILSENVEQQVKIDSTRSWKSERGGKLRIVKGEKSRSLRASSWIFSFFLLTFKIDFRLSRISFSILSASWCW